MTFHRESLVHKNLEKLTPFLDKNLNQEDSHYYKKYFNTLTRFSNKVTKSSLKAYFDSLYQSELELLEKLGIHLSEDNTNPLATSQSAKGTRRALPTKDDLKDSLDKSTGVDLFKSPVMGQAPDSLDESLRRTPTDLSSPDRSVVAFFNR